MSAYRRLDGCHLQAGCLDILGSALAPKLVSRRPLLFIASFTLLEISVGGFLIRPLLRVNIGFDGL